MSATHEATPVVRTCGGVTWFDTRELEWEPIPGLPGFFQKVLVRDDAGDPSVTLSYHPSLDPVAGAPDPDEPLPRDRAGRYRHFHRTVREFCFYLAGEVTNTDYERPEQTAGDWARKKQGFFMDRKAGSIHGTEPGLSSLTGGLQLNFREGGSGVWVGEHNYETETVHVDYDAAAVFTPTADAPHEAGPACLRNRGGMTLLDTRAMPWEPMPGYHRKVLVRDEAGEPSVLLVHVPPAGVGGHVPHRHLHRSVRELAYVLEGEAAVREYQSAEQTRGDLVRAPVGYFVDRRPGSIHGVEEPSGSPAGATILTWRQGGPGLWPGERGFETETIEIP